MNRSDLPALSGLVVSLALFVLGLSRSSRHQEVGGCHIYKYPQVTVYFFLAVALIFLAVPLGASLSALKGPAVPGDIAFVAVPFFILFFWAKRYRVVMDAMTFRFGAFRIREVSYSDLSQAIYCGNHVRGKLTLRTSSGARITFSSSINDFKSLIDDICGKLPNAIVMERRSD